jgi:hypothetical protein
VPKTPERTQRTLAPGTSPLTRLARRYCAHLHLLGSCPDCLLENNAFEFSMQRGLVIHGTHLATARNNVFGDVRGAAMYIEDGNEMLNSLEYNVAICPWNLNDPDKWGCTIPGTSNGQADTSLNQAGLWSLSASNNMLGNRFSNSFNGMLFETNAFGSNGRQFSEGKACTQFHPLGRVEGNTFHSHGRFGTYVLSSTWPKDIASFAELLAADGKVKDIDGSSCSGFDASGGDLGLPATLKNNVDYYNTVVGQYDAGDIQCVARERSATSRRRYPTPPRSHANNLLALASRMLSPPPSPPPSPLTSSSTQVREPLLGVEQLLDLLEGHEGLRRRLLGALHRGLLRRRECAGAQPTRP